MNLKAESDEVKLRQNKLKVRHLISGTVLKLLKGCRLLKHAGGFSYIEPYNIVRLSESQVEETLTNSFTTKSIENCSF